jgi:hypothetical protein
MNLLHKMTSMSSPSRFMLSLAIIIAKLQEMSAFVHMHDVCGIICVTSF